MVNVVETNTDDGHALGVDVVVLPGMLGALEQGWPLRPSRRPPTSSTSRAGEGTTRSTTWLVHGWALPAMKPVKPGAKPRSRGAPPRNPHADGWIAETAIATSLEPGCDDLTAVCNGASRRTAVIGERVVSVMMGRLRLRFVTAPPRFDSSARIRRQSFVICWSHPLERPGRATCSSDGLAGRPCFRDRLRSRAARPETIAVASLLPVTRAVTSPGDVSRISAPCAKIA